METVNYHQNKPTTLTLIYEKKKLSIEYCNIWETFMVFIKLLMIFNQLFLETQKKKDKYKEKR